MGTRSSTPISLAAVLAVALAAPGCRPKGDGPLYNPNQANERAPDSFEVRFQTTAGEFTVACHRSWAPNGTDRFYNLVKIGFFNDVAFFRVVRTPTPFVAQFGIHGDPNVASIWQGANIPTDLPNVQTNRRGTLTFAMAGSPDTRATQLFINYGNNGNLDKMGFAPLCEVTGNGMDTVDKLDAEYGESPDQGSITSQGNAYLKKNFPKLDYIVKAELGDATKAAAPSSTAPAPSASATPSAKGP